MIPEKLESSGKQEDQSRKRKLEPEIRELVGGVKKLRVVEPDPWELMEQMEWKEKSGRWCGEWSLAE